MFGIDDLIPMIPQNMMMEEDRNQRQDVAWHMQWDTQNFNSAQAAAQRNWSERMSNSQYQRATHDLRQAGLNPMLAYHQGGAGVPTGAAASASPAAAAAGGFAAHPGGGKFNETLQTASQIRVNDALEERTRAEAAKVRAEEGEILERTPTHAVNIDRMKQQIEESKAQVEKILQDTKTSAWSAAHLEQQITNLQEAVPHIRALIDQAKSLTALQGALKGKTIEETREIQQRVKANLPEWERTLKELERNTRERNVPREEQDRAAHDRFTGSLGALIRSLTGLGSYLK